MVLLDVRAIVEIVDHHAGGVRQAIVRRVTEPV